MLNEKLEYLQYTSQIDDGRINTEVIKDNTIRRILVTIARKHYFDFCKKDACPCSPFDAAKNILIAYLGGTPCQCEVIENGNRALDDNNNYARIPCPKMSECKAFEEIRGLQDTYKSYANKIYKESNNTIFAKKSMFFCNTLKLSVSSYSNQLSYEAIIAEAIAAGELKNRYLVVTQAAYNDYVSVCDSLGIRKREFNSNNQKNILKIIAVFLLNRTNEHQKSALVGKQDIKNWGVALNFKVSTKNDNVTIPKLFSNSATTTNVTKLCPRDELLACINAGFQLVDEDNIDSYKSGDYLIFKDIGIPPLEQIK